MLKRYASFLEEFDKRLKEYFSAHKEFLCCKKGCTECCEIGEYPFSRLEAEYIMSGYIKLLPNVQLKIKRNIENILKTYKYSENYQCPFLINKECALYDYRGIVCRTFGLAYVVNGIVKLPECVNSGLNYSKVYNKNKKEVILENPVKENLMTDKVLRSKLAEEYQLECGEIRPLIKWFM